MENAGTAYLTRGGAATDSKSPHAHVVARTASGDVVLIRRIRNGRVYYTAPGVALSESETAGAAAKRAAAEHLSLNVVVEDIIHAQDFGGVDHYFFTATIDSGAPAIWPELSSDDFELGTELDGSYEVVPLPATQLLAYDVRPWELAKRLCRQARQLA